MKKILLSFMLFSAVIALTGCDNGTSAKQAGYVEGGQTAVDASRPADSLEVYYFHRTGRCVSCVAMGEYVNKTMLEFYSDEMQNGKIDYREINIDLPENKDLARKFQASGSSLFINAVHGEEGDIQNVSEIWTWKSNEEVFKSNLKQKIDKLLGR